MTHSYYTHVIERSEAGAPESPPHSEASQGRARRPDRQGLFHFCHAWQGLLAAWDAADGVLPHLVRVEDLEGTLLVTRTEELGRAPRRILGQQRGVELLPEGLDLGRVRVRG